MLRINPAAAMRLSRDDFRKEILRLVAEIGAEQRLQLNVREQDTLVQELIDDMIGLGPLEPLLADDAITDIMVNGPNAVFVEKHGKLEQQPQIRFRDNQHVNNIAQRIAAGVGRRVDEASPDGRRAPRRRQPRQYPACRRWRSTARPSRSANFPAARSRSK